jgi:transcriptional regulator with XRE-family HTH domain
MIRALSNAVAHHDPICTDSALGRGLNVARRRRGLTAAMVAERAGVGLQTYRRVERGDPTVAMGTYLMAMFVLGLPWGGLEEGVDPLADEVGVALSIETLPKRVRPRKTPQPK